MGLLATFAHVNVYRPDAGHILRWIDLNGRTVYENTGAWPDAKVIRLV